MLAAKDRGCRKMTGKLAVLLLLFALQIDDKVAGETPPKCSPRHVHLAVGHDPATSVTVSFSVPSTPTCRDLKPVVLLGTRRKSLSRAVFETFTTKKYNSTLQVDDVWTNYTSDFFHHVRVDDLSPNTRYFCRCVVDESPETLSRRLRHPAHGGKRRHVDDSVAVFRTAPMAGHGFSEVKFAIVGDMGQSKNALITSQMILDDADISTILNVGDLAYANGRHNRWDRWFDKMGKLLRSHTMQIGAGNHDVEVDCASNEIFLGYENRFFMPQIRDAEIMPSPKGQAGPDPSDIAYPLLYEYGNSYYAFTYGPARVVFLNSFSSSAPGSKQYVWLLNELRSIDRKVTPWVFVIFHCPFYNTFDLHQHDPQALDMKKNFEPFLVEYKVNMAFSGHVHAYMRTKNVAHGKLNVTAPQHVLVGDGGQGVGKPKFLSDVPEEWVHFRDHNATGFGTVLLVNATHARWEWVHTAEKERVSDCSYVENQLFL